MNTLNHLSFGLVGARRGGGGLAALALSLLLATGTQAQETVVYSEGFESDDGGFTRQYSTSAGWQWGTPSGTVGPGRANGGSKCWGTVLNGTLPRPSEGSIVSPPITLPVLTSNQVARVRFWAFVAIDGMRDRAEFLVSPDGTSWQSLMQMYQAMDSTTNAAPAWRKYEIALDSSYSGRTVYLRFRAAVNDTSSTFYCGGATDLSGFYVDDIAITVYQCSGLPKTFTLRAWEDSSAWASCPWLAPWTGTEFIADNDIYSVARFAAGEYTDFYKLEVAPKAEAGRYLFEVQEKDSEDSFTDFAALLQVDHAAGVAIAPNETGMLSAYSPGSLLAPTSATTGDGADVLALLAAHDGRGYPAYSGDTVSLAFNGAPSAGGAVLVLGVKGFVAGAGAERPFTGPPAVVVETPDASGNWTERGRLLPRFRYSVAAFDLSAWLKGSNRRVRLRSVSHSIKYHEIDFVGLHCGPQPAFTVRTTNPQTASFGGLNLLDKLQAIDGLYAKLSGGEQFSLSFPALPLDAGQVRDFVFVSKGYYIPKGGSYLVYTWDGAAWALRDSFTFPGSFTNKNFDLSLFLPDANGEYKVRVWQDYQYEPAAIDWVQMTALGTNAPLDWAWDYRQNKSILAEVSGANDGLQAEWSSCPRNRITEYRFNPSLTNFPPIAPPTVPGPPWWINWVYSDRDRDPQVAVEIQVWAGPNATGKILWNPAVFYTSTNSLPYTGPDVGTDPAFARVRAFDGKDWGPWREARFGATNNCEEPFSLTAYPVETNTLRVRQTGLFYQTVAVTNTCDTAVDSCWLWVGGLPPGVTLYNALGSSNGVPYVVQGGLIGPGEGFEFALEYYVPTRNVVPEPGFYPQPRAAEPMPTPAGTGIVVDRCLVWTNRAFLVEFSTSTNKTYTIQYSSDLTSWKTARSFVAGTGSRVQWLDSGPPKTHSPPANETNRFYRVIQAP